MPGELAEGGGQAGMGLGEADVGVLCVGDSECRGEIDGVGLGVGERSGED